MDKLRTSQNLDTTEAEDRERRELTSTIEKNVSFFLPSPSSSLLRSPSSSRKSTGTVRLAEIQTFPLQLEIFSRRPLIGVIDARNIGSYLTELAIAIANNKNVATPNPIMIVQEVLYLIKPSRSFERYIGSW